MRIEMTSIPDVSLIHPELHHDERGSFYESWNRRAFQQIGLDVDFVQDNRSISHLRNTIRGLHLQLEPHAQSKLVSVTQGSIFDVVVDLRPESPTYGNWFSVTLTASEPVMLFIPEGCAHGFRSLEPETAIAYKVSSYYCPAAEHGIHWQDSTLSIQWGIDATDAIISERDANLPSLKKFVHEHSQPAIESGSAVDTSS